MAQTIHTRAVYINNGEHDNPHELPKENSEGSLNVNNVVYTHIDLATKLLEEIEKLEYIYQHFQESEKIQEIDPQTPTEHIEDTLYLQINNNIEYGLFENVIVTIWIVRLGMILHNDANNLLETRPQCAHTYDHISQQLDSLADAEQQHTVYTSKMDASLFTSDTTTQCAFNIIPKNTEAETNKPMEETSENNAGIHSHSKHKYRDTFGDAHIQYHNFNNGDAFTHKDKYTALLQQELQNP